MFFGDMIISFFMTGMFSSRRQELKMKRENRILPILMILFILGQYSSAEPQTERKTISVVISNWAPYKGEGLLHNGVVTDITQTALERIGYHVKISSIPWKRALLETIEGKHDILPAIWKTDERKKDLLFSDVVLKSRVVVVTRKSSTFTFTSLEDLSGMTIGVGRGWGYPDEFLEADYFTRQPVADLELNIRKLIYKRLDVIVGEEIAVRYIVTTQFPNYVDSLNYSETAIQEKPLYIAISRAHPDAEEIIREFNEALKEMYSDGSFDEILKKHSMLKQPTKVRDNHKSTIQQK